MNLTLEYKRKQKSRISPDRHLLPEHAEKRHIQARLLGVLRVLVEPPRTKGGASTCTNPLRSTRFQTF